MPSRIVTRTATPAHAAAPNLSRAAAPEQSRAATPKQPDWSAQGGLKRLREARGLSLAALAEQTELTRSFLARLERGAAIPSIAAARTLAEALGVGIGAVFGTEPDEHAVTLVRRGERRPLDRTGHPAGPRSEAIALAPTRGPFEAVIDHPPFEPVAEQHPPGHRPAGQDGHAFLFVVKGKVEVTFPHRALRLGPGDTLMFDAQVPHEVLSLRPRQAKILVIVTPEAPSGETALAGW